jgi:glycosyltransferase involved in cell wall biosynthesis
MRVLLATEASSAGVGRHVIDLAHGLSARGCSVRVAYSLRRSDAAFEQGLAVPGIASDVVDMRRAPHPADALAVWQLGRVIHDHGPFDVVHAHSTKAGALLRALPRPVLRGARVVYTPHCVFTMNPHLGRAAFLATRTVERLLALRTDALIAVSPSEQDHLLELGIEPWRVRCIPNGLAARASTERAAARAELGLAEDDVAVGFVGRLCAQKDPLLMVRAFARTAARAPRAVLLMVGSGPLEGEAQAEARELGLGQRVRWLGARPGAEVMPAFDVFAMTSSYEAMPYVLIEALACGLPIVSTAVGGAELAVIEGRTGAIARWRTPGAFEQALAPLLHDSALRRRMAHAARRHAARFDVDTMVESTLELYDGLLGIRPADRAPARCALEAVPDQNRSAAR